MSVVEMAAVLFLILLVAGASLVEYQLEKSDAPNRVNRSRG
jgi:hypothetical protein